MKKLILLVLWVFVLALFAFGIWEGADPEPDEQESTKDTSNRQ